MINAWLLSAWLLVAPAQEVREFKITFYCSCAKCCGKYSPQRGGKGLTATGFTPLQFRTAATGDRSLLGRWVTLQDLGGPVFVSDVGGGVARNQLDVFIGGPEWHRHAVRMGVHHWQGEVHP